MEHAVTPCPACGQSNPAGKRFCGDCGSPLPTICPTCGSENPSGKRFCGDCGAALTHAAGTTASRASLPSVQTPRASDPTPAAREEERRLVTALFCDLVGFTPLSEQLDPEEVRELQADYFSAMSQQIERYGGTVEKYAGDAILALFGAPIAHEDDAERAVLCSLGMQAAIEDVAKNAQERWDVEPRIRVGVNTGEVVSGTWTASARQDVAVTGDALNTSARLQAAAEPGEILVGSETMRLTKRRIRYGPARTLTLKGKRATVPAYAALGIRDEIGERWEEGPRVSPLVGRDRELLMLLDAWTRTQGGEGQLVTLIGEPGVGKSRLVAETVERVASADVARLVHARCLSYGQTISLWLVTDLLRSLFGIREQDGREEIRGKLDTGLRSLFSQMGSTSQEETRDVLGEVLGLPAGGSAVAQAGPKIRRQALLRSLRLLLGALVEPTPCILILDDLHWIDQASQEVLQEVLADVPGLRLLVLTTQRSGWNAPWSEWAWTERITLRPLQDVDAAVLAGAVLGGVTLSKELEQYVAERAGGNPFFVEEMLRALEETGGLEQRDGAVWLAPGAAQRLPATLTEILLSRLDRLESQVKSVVQVGSVIGRSFAVRLLAQVMGREQSALELPLTAVQQAEIAFPRRGADVEYVFKHVTMRDAAYNTLVSRRRQELHLGTARAIAELYPADEYVEMIAYHYARTEEHREAARWLERAGDRAAAVYANDSAIGHYRDTLRLLEEESGDPLGMAQIEEKLGGVLYTTGRYDEALEMLGHAVSRYQDRRDLEATGRVTAKIGMAHRYRGTPEEGIPIVQPMIDLLAWSGTSPALASLHLALGTLNHVTGHYEEFLSSADQAAVIARAIGDARLLGESLERQATARSELGRHVEALALFEQAIPLIEAGGDPLVLARAFYNAGSICEQLGSIQECKRYFELSLGVVERIGSPDQMTFPLGSLANVHYTLGEWDKAHACLERAMALLGDERPAGAGHVLFHLGALSLYEGQWEESRRWLDQALALADSIGDPALLGNVRALLAQLEILSGRPDEALRHVEQRVQWNESDLFVRTTGAWALLETGQVDGAEEVIREVVQRAHLDERRIALTDALRVQGMMFAQRERFAEAEEAYMEGLALARSLPWPYAEARLLHQLGRIKEQCKQPEEARQYLRDALAIFYRLGAEKDIEQVEQILSIR